MSIRNKIIRGYVLALGLATSGVLAGLAVGNYYQQKAVQNRQDAAGDRQFLSTLQLKILYNRPAKQLSPHLSSPVSFHQESQEMLERIESIQLLLERYNVSARPTSPKELNRLLQDYEQTVAAFQQEAQSFVRQVTPLIAPVGAENPEAQDLLVRLVNSPEFGAFIEFPDQLQEFTQLAEDREQAAEADLHAAEILRNQIILVSLLAALTLALILSIRTSQAIVRPLQEVTERSRQITRESNFELRLPVNSSDEIGILANAFNQLIEKVKQLLHKLNQNNAELEQALHTLNQQQLQLVQAEKMSSLGCLVSGIAHEINNPVNFIYGNLIHVQTSTQELLSFIQLCEQLCCKSFPDIQAHADAIDLDFLKEDLPKMLTSMQVGADRIRQIVLTLRNFSRIDEAAVKQVNLHDGIESTLMLLQHRLRDRHGKSDIQVIRDYGDIPELECHASQINQVFMNILSNAIDVLDEADQQAQLQSQPIVPGCITIRTSVLDANWIQVAIIDNGPGMPAEIQEQIFTPFFTTKSVGKGTGLGMSISYQIITEKHSGKLMCFSEKGHGSEFIIQLPIQQGDRTPS
jgi:signal transduction histidine kinase